MCWINRSNVWTSSNDSEQSARMHSLILYFAYCNLYLKDDALEKQQILSNNNGINKSVQTHCNESDQNARMNILINVAFIAHCSLDTPRRVTGKQWRPKSDAAERGV